MSCVCSVYGKKAAVDDYHVKLIIAIAPYPGESEYQILSALSVGIFGLFLLIFNNPDTS